jgi:hypothetical protein
MKAALAGLALACAGCVVAPTVASTGTMSAAAPATPAPLRWWITLHEDLSLDERLCLADGRPLEAGDLAGFGPVAARAREVASSPRLVDGCAIVRIDLAEAARLLHDRSTAVRANDAVVLASPDVWLWTRARPTGGVLTLTSVPGVRAALPFPRVAGTDDTFDVDASTWRLLSTAAFGAIDLRALHVAGATLDIVTLPGERLMVDTDIDRWLGAAAAAVATGAGPRRRFPFDRVLVIVEPVQGGGVPFGMVTRGGGPQAHLLLGARARVDDVLDDWVAVHELSHLLHPLVGLDEAWFGEGLATWHQVVLRARAGLISEAEAWATLADGFERGAAAAERGPWTLSLREASARMRAEGRWLQTYWGGAAIVLVMDVALRRCGDTSIDDVVAALRAEQPRVDARRVAALDIVARAAAVSPACATLQDDVEAMLDEPFPGAARPLLEALATGPTDPSLAAVAGAILSPGAAAAGAGCGGRRMSGP